MGIVSFYSGKAKCPFYEKILPGNKGKGIGIQCEQLNDNIGFEVRMITQFRYRSEMKDYFELFCEDCYKQCPYFQAMMETKYKDAR